MTSEVHNISADSEKAENYSNQIKLMSRTESVHNRTMSVATKALLSKELMMADKGACIEMSQQPLNTVETMKSEMHIRQDSIMYEKNKQSDRFILVLSGKIDICSGKEGFHSEIDYFHFLGCDALTSDIYIPDFTAKVVGDASVLQIKKADYKQYCSK